MCLNKRNNMVIIVVVVVLVVVVVVDMFDITSRSRNIKYGFYLADIPIIFSVYRAHLCCKMKEKANKKRLFLQWWVYHCNSHLTGCLTQSQTRTETLFWLHFIQPSRPKLAAYCSWCQFIFSVFHLMKKNEQIKKTLAVCVKTKKGI